MSSSLPTRALALLICICCIVLASANAQAHAQLRASTPAPNGSLPAGASQLALRFSETVEFGRTDVWLLGPREQLIATRAVRVPGEPQMLRFETEPLASGLYTARWRALSVDGDITQGSFQFTVGETDETASAVITSWEPAEDEAKSRFYRGLLRALMLGGLLTATGAAFFWQEIQRLSRLPTRHANALVILTGLAGLGALSSIAELALRLDIHPGSAVATTAGKLLAVIAALALLQCALAIGTRVTGARPGRALIAVGLLGLLVNTVAGHAIAGDDLNSAIGDLVLLATAGHVIAVSLWVGGTLALVISASETSGPRLSQLMASFSPWAVAAVVLLAASGLLLAVNALDQPASLWNSDYGRFISLKTLGFGVLLIFGYWHRYHAGPRAASTPIAALRARNSLTAETATMVAVLTLAGLLTASAQPGISVDSRAGPPVGQIHELDFGDYHGRILLPDPLTTRPDQQLWLELGSHSFADLRERPAHLLLEAPPQSSLSSRRLALETVRPGVWKTNGKLFHSPGDWTLTVQVDGPRGAAQSTLVVSVAPVTSAQKREPSH